MLNSVTCRMEVSARVWGVNSMKVYITTVRFLAELSSKLYVDQKHYNILEFVTFPSIYINTLSEFAELLTNNEKSSRMSVILTIPIMYCLSVKLCNVKSAILVQFSDIYAVSN
jgi:hypothetical protein